MTVCGSCGVENPDENRFCDDCGAALAMSCPACGTPVRAGKRFCGQCGESLSMPASPPVDAVPAAKLATSQVTADAPVGLRWVSVLFVDLVGFTAWSEGQDPADVRDVLSGYFELARAAVTRHGGVIEKFIGDAVMAVWGAQGALVDDAPRSVRAALELVAGVAVFGESRGMQLAARGGVVTGEVAAWASSGEGLVTGDRVNTAARVQGAAEPGQVLVDEATRESALHVVEFADERTVSVKGKSAPLRLWRAVRALSLAGSGQHRGMVEAPLVGRTRELGMLKDLFHATAEDSRLRVAVVSGAQGAGKSRLISEFVTYLDGLTLKVLWHEGRCVSYGDGVAFWPWAQMVRQRLGLAEDAPKEQVAEALNEQLPTWIPDEDERDFVAARLAVLLGESDAVFEQLELFAGWRLFSERLAMTGPVVLVYEDFHWSDEGLRDFLDHMVERSGRVPIFIVIIAQPELAERHPNWLARPRAVTPVSVDPLSDPLMRDLVNHLVRSLPDHTATQLVRHAQGVPLYAVETVRMLLDRGVIERRDGSLQVVGEITELGVPASLTGLVAARLDGLPSQERDLMLGVSVLGESFPRVAIGAISQVPAERVDEMLRSLVGKELLTVRDDPLSPERGQYTFVQNLLRSVAYDLVPRRQRTAWHAAVAEHLRSAFPGDGEDVIEMIAAHYADAHAAAAPAAREHLREQAMRAFGRAGYRAGTLGAPDVAEQYFRRAATLATDELDTTNYTAEAANMARRSGRFGDAVAGYESVVAAHNDAGRHLEAARLAADLGTCLATTGRLEAGIAHMQHALASADELGLEESVRAQLHASICSALFEEGDRAGAGDHADRAIALASRLGLSPALAGGLAIRAWLLLEADQVEPAEAALELAVVHWAGHPLEAAARGNLAELRFQSDLPGAVDEYHRALQIARRFGSGFLQALTLANLAYASLLSGDWDAAEAYATEGVSVAPDDHARPLSLLPLLILHAARGDGSDVARCAAEMEVLGGSENTEEISNLAMARAIVAIVAGEPGAALDVASPAARVAVETEGFRFQGFRLLWPLALEAALATSQTDEAESLLDLVDTADHPRIPPYLDAQYARYRARLRADQGRLDDVEADFERSIDSLRELGYPYWLACTQADFACWLMSQHRGAAARPHLMAAREVLTRLGARPQLDRTEALVAELSGIGA